MKVGLVLSGGGARSFAQIGALIALEEHGVEVAAIAGTSTGAVLGALRAAGNSANHIREIVEAADFDGLLTFDGGGGLSGHEGMERFLGEHLPPTFEQLQLPLAVPATDIQSGEQVIFTEGPLVPAVCASNAFPGLFVPVQLGGRELMDGGILNNVPVDLIGPLTREPRLVVDVQPSAEARIDFDQETGVWERLVAPLASGIPLTVQVLTKAYMITQGRLIDVLYAMHPPDFVIRPDLGNDFQIKDFGRFEEGVRIGHEAVVRFLDGPGGSRLRDDRR